MKKIELKKVAGNEKVCVISGISLIAQALVFGVLSLVLWGKKRSLAKAFAAVAAVGGIGGVLLLAFRKKKADVDENDEEEEDLFDDSFDEDDVFCNFENEDGDCCCGDCEQKTEETEESENA